MYPLTDFFSPGFFQVLVTVDTQDINTKRCSQGSDRSVRTGGTEQK